MNILNSKNTLQLQINFSAGIHVHNHLDLHDGVSQPKSASLPKKAFDSIMMDMLSFLIWAQLPNNSKVTLLINYWHS